MVKVGSYYIVLHYNYRLELPCDYYCPYIWYCTPCDPPDSDMLFATVAVNAGPVVQSAVQGFLPFASGYILVGKIEVTENQGIPHYEVVWY